VLWAETLADSDIVNPTLHVECGRISIELINCMASNGSMINWKECGKNRVVTGSQCLPVWTEDERLFPGVHSYRAAPEYTSEALPFELPPCMTVIFIVRGYGESP
jgi:hypothetical protein